jgi:hypothetical protein
MGADAPNAKQRIALSNSTPGSGVNPPTFVDREFPRPRKGRWLLAIVLVGLALLVVSVSSWLIFSLNAGNLSRTTLETASTPTPTPSPTNTPVTTGIVSPSGSPIASSAAAIITNVQTSNGYDNNFLPTQVTSAFSLNQVIDVTFNIHFIQPGTIEAKFYADKQPLQSYTNTLQWNDGNNSNGVLNPAGSGTYSTPTKQGAVELYWCPQFDCSNEQLAAFTTFTVS